MSVATTDALPVATLPEVRQLLDSAARRGRTGGVIGLRARLAWDGAAELTHAGTPVTVALCGSALAVRDALRHRAADRWLVILTDRDEQDLGVGILSHLINQTLRNPDPWGAVQEQFAATRVDRRLVSHPRARDLAAGLLAARPDTGWPPARGGLLTVDHAFAAVASSWFDLGAAVSDPVTDDVLRWSVRPGQAERVVDLRSATNEVLAEATLTWLAGRCGRAEPLVAALVRRGQIDDLVPLGLAARAVLAGAEDSPPWTRLETQHLDGHAPDRQTLDDLAQAAERVALELLHDPGEDAARRTGRLLGRADALVESLRAEAGAATSTVLRRSLTDRLARLGESMRRSLESVDSRASVGVDRPLVDAERLPDVEAALGAVREHALAGQCEDHRVTRATAGVRLVRWLALEAAAPSSDLSTLTARHRDVDAWVDRAYADAWRGVDEEALSRGLAAVVAATRRRRAEHDQEYAAVLARGTATPCPRPPDVLFIEDLIETTVVPLARGGQPVLLVVADGMSAAVSSEIVDDIESRYDSWVECLPGHAERRSVALAVLPSLTKVSRCSLFTGSLAVGEQGPERSGFASLMRAQRLTGTLLHRLTLDTSGAGNDLAPDVRVAIDDVEGQQVVACVLNTIDDALDRSDPGMDWTTEAVTHLRPLMERARRAGRVVVLTSDHGHIIERREAHQVRVGDESSNRSAPWDDSAPEGAVRVRGERVLLHDHDAMLAVDERLRFGPLKAGYHGGAAPAEVVIPVHVLTPGEAPEGWRLAVPQAPAWWRSALVASTESDGADIDRPSRTVLPPAPEDTPTLFDEVEEPAPTRQVDLAAQVVASTTYADQRARATRVTLDDEQVAALLRLLVSTAGHRVDQTSAAGALGIARIQLAGALPMVQRLLNVEQYQVLERDPDTSMVVLDIDLLVEQFGITR